MLTLDINLKNALAILKEITEAINALPTLPKPHEAMQVSTKIDWEHEARLRDELLTEIFNKLI